LLIKQFTIHNPIYERGILESKENDAHVIYGYIAHPHLLVRATSEQFLPTWSTFRHGLASESHWLEPRVGTHRSLVTHTCKCEWAIMECNQGVCILLCSYEMDVFAL
jgi:hypothetical protein